MEQEIRDLKRERTVLASRNKALEQRVQELKGEMRISKEPSVVLRDVKKLGQETIRRYGSDVKYADIQAFGHVVLYPMTLSNAVMAKSPLRILHGLFSPPPSKLSVKPAA